MNSNWMRMRTGISRILKPDDAHRVSVTCLPTRRRPIPLFGQRNRPPGTTVAISNLDRGKDKIGLSANVLESDEEFHTGHPLTAKCPVGHCGMSWFDPAERWGIRADASNVTRCKVFDDVRPGSGPPLGDPVDGVRNAPAVIRGRPEGSVVMACPEEDDFSCFERPGVFFI